MLPRLPPLIRRVTCSTRAATPATSSECSTDWSCACRRPADILRGSSGDGESATDRAHLHSTKSLYSCELAHSSTDLVTAMRVALTRRSSSRSLCTASVVQTRAC
eukprot:2644115-Prymnesium_polylepis.2